MSERYLRDYVEGSLGKMCWNFCANCEKLICNAEEYTMYEGLCKECYILKAKTNKVEGKIIMENLFCKIYEKSLLDVIEVFFCQNCEKVILDDRKYTMYEGLCKECYYKRVYQEDMTPEQIAWIQPKEDKVIVTIPGCEPLECTIDDITIISNHPEYECKRPMFDQFKQAIDARLREKNKDSNER